MRGGHGHKAGRGAPPETNYLPRLRRVIHLDGSGVEYRNEWWQWKATQKPPWKRRAHNRRHNQIARASRRVNR